MIFRIFKSKPTQSSPFSEFIRTASSAEKKRVYGEVHKKATERQERVLKKASTG
jgi:hypothetical protein